MEYTTCFNSVGGVFVESLKGALMSASIPAETAFNRVSFYSTTLAICNGDLTHEHGIAWVCTQTSPITWAAHTKAS